MTVGLLVFAGCGTTKKPGSMLTAEQAQAMAMELANADALVIHHRQPFEKTQPAHFEQGRWIWVAREGFGLGDIEAKVELAADGSTNHVELQVLDNQQYLK